MLNLFFYYKKYIYLKNGEEDKQEFCSNKNFTQ